MTIAIFAGPTLSVDDARAVLPDAEYLPPARQGDLYLAARAEPAAIGLIDGLFDQVNAVSHKEILWAMTRGIHVFGAASMGALRAAELSVFGMQGVGEIYRWYAAGEAFGRAFGDDDEVAVTHGPAETGYRTLSEAMVNIRATLHAALVRGAIAESTHDALIAAGKPLFYPDRGYPRLFAEAASRGVPEHELAAVRALVAPGRESGRIDQKRRDALALLARVRDAVDGGVEPARVRYHFARTDAWEAIRADADARRPAP